MDHLLHNIEMLITNKRNLEQEQFRIIAENSRDLIKIIDIEGYIVYASPSHMYILGQDPLGFLGRTVFDSIHPDDLSKLKNAISEILNSEKPAVVELRKQHKEGYWIWLEASCSPVIHNDGELQSIVIVTRDISERKEYEKKLEFMAFHDFLTGLYNRRKFKQEFKTLIENAPEKNQKLALLMLDLNKFKWINDNLGHDAGDAILQEYSKRLLSCKGEGDILGRLGGDEFALLMADVRDENEVYEIIDRITASLKEPCVLEDQEYTISTSIGVSFFPEHGHSFSQLSKCADIALYKAKSAGLNNYAFYQ
jgi:diguanylate cyclase (GGDEF)-like protein/PAS domain S-box-containing protein